MPYRVAGHSDIAPAIPGAGPKLASDALFAAPVASRRGIVAIGLVVFIAFSDIALFVATANPLIAAAPAIAAALAFAIWKTPLRHLIYALLFLACAVFAPADVQGPVWSVMRPVQDFLFVYLNRATGISALAILGIEALYVLLFGLAIIRFSRSSDIDARGRTPGVNALSALVAFSFAAVLGLELWGILRGGDFRGSLFQFRQLFWLPLLTWLASYALRGPDDWRPVARVVTAGTCIKIALGIYYLMHDQWPIGVYPKVMTSHHDSVLFVAVFFLWCAAWMHRPRVSTIIPTMLVCGWLLLGLVLNGRRIAYVSLFASLAILFILLRGPAKRWLTRNGLRVLPLVIVYMFLARTHSGGVFKPGNAIMSVSTQEDASSTWRDAENFNLLATLRPNLLLGSGWGHEYHEVIKLDDISRFMPQYRLVAHNSILWLLGIGGILGFLLLWLPIVAGVFLATRSYHFARDAFERTAAATIVAVLVAFANQAWGDMGTQGGVTILLVAVSLALAGKLARTTGAWPDGIRLTGHRGHG